MKANFKFKLKLRQWVPLLLVLGAMNMSADVLLEDVIPDANFRYFLRNSAYGQNTGAFTTAQNNGQWSPSDSYGNNPLDKDTWTEAEFTIIKVLNLNGKSAKVASLEGVNLFTSLNTLKCKEHQLTGVVDLSELTRLMELDLSGNQITGLTLYAWAYNLTSIDVSRNCIDKDSFLALAGQLYDRKWYTTKGIIKVKDKNNSDENNPDYNFVSEADARAWIVQYSDGSPLDVGMPLELAFPDENLRLYMRKKAYSYNTGLFSTAQNNGIWEPNGDYGDNPLDKDTWTAQEFAIIKVLKMNKFTDYPIRSLEGITLFRNLNILNCSGHELSGEVDLTGLTRLTELDLSNNQITNLKTSPSQVGYSGAISLVNISNNQFSKTSLIEFCRDIGSGRHDQSYPSIYLSMPDGDGNQVSNYAVFELVHKFYNVYYSDGTLINDMAYEKFNINDLFHDTNLVAYLKEKAYEDNQNVVDGISETDYEGFWSGYFSEGTNGNVFNKDMWSSRDIYMLRELHLEQWNEENYGDASHMITDLSGIEEFVKLEQLHVNGHQLSTLDVSGMLGLRILRCQGQKPGLTSLVMKNCDALFQVYCDENNLEHIDVTDLPSLKMLRCNNNPVGNNGLDVSQNPLLEWLDCYNCKLPSIDVTHNPRLQVLYCYETRDNEADGPEHTRRGIITELDLSKNPELVQLRCSNNPLTDLDLSHNPKLEILYCNSIKLDENKLQKNLPLLPELRRLSCYNDTLDVLDVSNNTKLWELICYKNQLKRLDLSQNEALTYLSCGENQEGVDERNVPMPNGGNYITTLDVSNNVNLETLHCCQMWLTELDLSGLTQLADLDYAVQERTIQAEHAMLVNYVNNQPVSKDVYYMRMDNNTSDNGKLLKDRIQVTDWDHISNFDLSLVDMDSWTCGDLFQGSRGEGRNSAPRRAVATIDDLEAERVTGKILVLNNVTESADGATGTVTYKYDVRKEAAAPAEDAQTEFTLHWYADPAVITAVEEVKVTGEVDGVDYYNALGLKSPKPWPGVNIVITRYSNGMQKSEKVMF